MSRRELLALGHTVSAIRAMVERGDLVSVAHGVYLAGPRLGGNEGWWQDVAAAAARGPSVLLTGQAAAVVYGLDGFDPGVPIAVQTSRTGSTRSRRLARLEPPERVRGVWCTGPGETLLGLGAGLSPRPGCAAAHRRLTPTDLVELAVESALYRGLTTVDALTELCEIAGARRPGRSVLVEVLQRRPDQPPTESYLETRCVQLMRDAGLPTFDRQVELADEDGTIGRVDFHRDGVVIELVGRAWHLERFDPDHGRYARLTGAGYRFLPFTFGAVERRPGHVAAKVAATLARAGS